MHFYKFFAYIGKKEREKMLLEIILCVVSAGVGTFICEILEKTSINVWLGRGISCVVAVVLAIVLYKLLIKKVKRGLFKS